MTYFGINPARHLAIAMVGLFLTAPANGQTPPLAELVDRADAIIAVEVDFVPYG